MGVKLSLFIHGSTVFIENPNESIRKNYSANKVNLARSQM